MSDKHSFVRINQKVNVNEQRKNVERETLNVVHKHLFQLLSNARVCNAN